MAEKHRKGKRPRNDDRGLVCLADRVGNNGADDAAADGDQDGVIPGTNPLVAAWGRPQVISAGRVDDPVVCSMEAVETLTLRPFVAGVGGLRFADTGPFDGMAALRCPPRLPPGPLCVTVQTHPSF